MRIEARKALVRLGYPVRLQKLVCAKAKNFTQGLKWLRSILLSFKGPSIHINSALSNDHPMVTRTWHPRHGQVQLDTSEIDKATHILHDLEEIMFVKWGRDKIYKIPSALLRISRISIHAALYQLVFDELSHLRTRFVL